MKQQFSARRLGLAIGLVLGLSWPPAAVAAEISIAPPPIAKPSYTGPSGRFDVTYIGFDKIDGDGLGFSFNAKEPLSEVSGYNVVGGFYGFSFGDGDSTATIFNLGLNYERRLLGGDSMSMIGFVGPMFSYLYTDIYTGTGYVSDSTTLYGAQGGVEFHFGAEDGLQFAPFVVFQSLTGSDIDSISTTSIGVDLLFGDWSLSGALNQSEEDDVTLISVGYRW